MGSTLCKQERRSFLAAALTMLPPTDARVSESLVGKLVPHNCREKMLATCVCFTRESKKGSRLLSGWREKERERHGNSVVGHPPSDGKRHQVKAVTSPIAPLPQQYSGTASPRIPSWLQMMGSIPVKRLEGRGAEQSWGALTVFLA